MTRRWEFERQTEKNVINVDNFEFYDLFLGYPVTCKYLCSNHGYPILSRKRTREGNRGSDPMRSTHFSGINLLLKIIGVFKRRKYNL